MDMLYISGRAAVDDASQLIETYGENAGQEAAARAAQSRSNDNFVRFCHWRQIERMIVALSSREVAGTVH